MTVLDAVHSLRKLDRHGAELVRKKRSIKGPLSLRDAREGCLEEMAGKRSNWISRHP